MHENIHPPPSLALKCVGLITRKDIATSKHTSQKIKKIIFTDASPHIITALQKWALIQEASKKFHDSHV